MHKKPGDLPYLPHLQVPGDLVPAQLLALDDPRSRYIIPRLLLSEPVTAAAPRPATAFIWVDGRRMLQLEKQLDVWMEQKSWPASTGKPAAPTVIHLTGDLLSKTIDQCDFDVLAHITCPVRYMTHRYKRKTDVMPFEAKIREILQKVIDRGIALEYNTAGFQQLDDVFALYRSMGGTRITLGSDAHQCTYIAGGFAATAEKLRTMGFEHYCYYQNRTAHKVKL